MGRRELPYRLKIEPGRSSFWLYKLPGMRAFKSTGLTDERAARRWVERRLTVKVSDSQSLFGEYAEGYFTPDCPYTTRQHNRGNLIKEMTTSGRRGNLEIHILPKWGRIRLCDLSPLLIESWAAGLDYAPQTRKHILAAMKIVLRDAFREGVLHFDPALIEPPIIRYDGKVVLTQAEALRLFDDDLTHWGGSKRIGVLCAILYSGGLRTQDARALEWEQVIPEHQGIIVDRTVDSDGKPSRMVKGKNFGAIVLPERTMRMLMDLPRCGQLVFPGRGGGYLSRRHPGKALEGAVERAKITTPITPHGLKHCYTTRMGQLIPELGIDIKEIALKEFTRHRSGRMAAYYDHEDLRASLAAMFEKYAEKINTFWGQL